MERHAGTEKKLENGMYQVTCSCGEHVGNARPTDQQAWGEHIIHLAGIYPRVDNGAF